MSKVVQEFIVCPKCGQENVRQVWLSWNSWQSPEMSNPNTREEATGFKCPNCQKTLSNRFLRFYIPLQYKRWFVPILRLILRKKNNGHTSKDEVEKTLRAIRSSFWSK